MTPRLLVLAFAVLLLVLVATSPPQRVGDAGEYLAMAMNLARLQPPALSPADIVRVERQLARGGFTGFSLTQAQLRGPGGRQDFFHFWFYPALAAPGIWLTDVLGVNPTYGFAALNVVLFLGALWIVSTRVEWWLAAALFCGPVLWWIDKSHTEVFTFSLLSVAVVLLCEAPWWSMVAVGAAATQNPPIALLAPCIAVAAPLLRPGAWRDRRFQVGAAVAFVLTMLHPVYYEWRLGLPTPQILQGTQARIPTVKELGAVLWDPNIGLLFQAPLLALAFVAAMIALCCRPRAWVRSLEVWLVIAGACFFLVSFAQTTNFNHGATPGISRYALWLLPLGIPLLQRAAIVTSPGGKAWWILLALASCLWSVVAFQPRQPEQYDVPSRAASVLWSRWPSLDNPLPEIFSERISATEPGLVPAATADCTKVLLIGGQWPVPCTPQRVPPLCATPDALCYANQREGGYAFVRAAPPPGYAFERRRTWTWNEASRRGVDRILETMHPQALRRIPQSAPGAMVRATENVSWTFGLQSEDELFVYVAEPGEGASITLRLPGTMSGALLDPATGDEIEPVRIDTRAWDLTKQPLPQRDALVLALTRTR